MITLNSITLLRGPKVLLQDADLTVHPGQKWGIIGANGSGKTSLFKLLLGELHEDSGNIKMPRDWRLAHMAQEVETTSKPAVEYVIDGDSELRDIEEAIRQAELSESDKPSHGEHLATLYSALEAADGYTANARAQRLLKGLGFNPGDDQRPVDSFSGGWRIRLNLARALMCRSDLLLLDEPTNHLDLDATVWLEQWLNSYAGTLLIISHDRDFLDNVVNHIVNFENAKLISYSGNYSAYETQKAERLALQSAAYQKQQERVAEIEDFVRRFRAKATKARQAQSRLKELERMEKIAPAHVDSPFTFRFPVPEKIPQTLITFSQTAIGYGDKPIVDNIELGILASSRIGLLGHNGAGKTTLIKSLANALPLIRGERTEGAHLKLGYFAQHQLEALDLNASAALHLQRITPKATEQKIRNFLGGFGFQGERAFEPITHFSGGEKARLAIAIIAWQKPNLLLLDEPTNHLDLEVRHALTLALQAFEGAIVIVSHDRHLLRNTVDEFLLVDNGKVEPFNGDLEDYQRWLFDGGNEAEAPSNTPTLSKADKKQQRQAAAALRESLKPYTQAIKKLEDSMEALRRKLASVEKELADPQLYADNNERLALLLKEQGSLKSEIENIEELWLLKSEELEAVKADF